MKNLSYALYNFNEQLIVNDEVIMYRRLLMTLLAALTLSLLFPAGVFADDAQKLSNPPELYAESAILVDADTGQILLEKNMNKKMYPASITKVMTCLLAMERAKPGDVVTVTDEVVAAVPRNTTHIALTGGEQLTVEQLEYAMMVESANDAANMLAAHISGSTQAFAMLMNDRAKELGAKDTHFTNAHGLPDPSHYTSAYDMALITRAAMQHPQFRSLAGAAAYEIPPTNKQSEARRLNNRNYMFTLNDTYPGAFAGKTGWTEEAGHTLVTLAERNGVTLICIVMHSDGVVDAQYIDSTAILDYGFDNFTRAVVSKDRVEPKTVLLTGADGTQQQARLTRTEDMPVLLPPGVTIDDLSVKLSIPDMLAADQPGEVQLYFPETVRTAYRAAGAFPLTFELIQSAVIPSDDVAKGGWFSLPPVVLKAGIVFAALVVLWLLIRTWIRWRYKARRHKRLRQVEERERRAAEKKAAQRPPVIRAPEPPPPVRQEPASPQLSNLWSVPTPAVSPSTRTAPSRWRPPPGLLAPEASRRASPPPGLLTGGRAAAPPTRRRGSVRMQELSSPPSDQSIEAAVQTIDATLARLRAQPEELSADMHKTSLQMQPEMRWEPAQTRGDFAAQQNMQQEPGNAAAQDPEDQRDPMRQTPPAPGDEAMRRSRRLTLIQLEDESEQEPAGRKAPMRETPPAQGEETPPRRSRMETASRAVDEAMRRSRRRTLVQQEDESAQEPDDQKAPMRETPPAQGEETPPRRSRMETASRADDEAMRRSRRRTMYTENAQTPLRQRSASSLQSRPRPGAARRSDALEQPADGRTQL